MAVATVLAASFWQSVQPHNNHLIFLCPKTEHFHWLSKREVFVRGRIFFFPALWKRAGKVSKMPASAARSAQGICTGQCCSEQQSWAEGQVCAWTLSDSCFVGAQAAPVQLRINMQQKGLYSENSTITITQGEYCHYLTVCLCWLFVRAQVNLPGEFRALFHSNLHPTGTVMVNA